MSADAEIYRERLEEVVVEGKRLGRHVNHDPRSKQYRVARAATIVSRRWERKTPILDQGNLGSCTGNAATGALGTEPFYDTLSGQLATGLKLDEAEAVSIYSRATEIDPYQGTYPPDDTGSDGLSVAKAAKERGLISGYVHALGLDELLAGLQVGPMLVGTRWLTGMDDPDASGRVHATGSVRGGHEYLCVGVDVEAQLLWFDNSWGTGFGLDGTFCMSYEDMRTLLADDGDATQFVPLSQPAPTPTPTPTPGAASFPGATVPVDQRIHHAAARAGLSVADYLNRHFGHYFGLHETQAPADHVIAGREPGPADGVPAAHDREDYRDSASGRFTTEQYAEQNPGTTQHESQKAGEEPGEREVHRDSETGQFVSQEYAQAHPDTTEEDHV
jgi:hypothetical protein